MPSDHVWASPRSHHSPSPSVTAVDLIVSSADDASPQQIRNSQEMQLGNLHDALSNEDSPDDLDADDTSQDRDSGSRSPAVMEPRHSEAHGKGEEPAMEMKVLETGMLFTEGLLEDDAFGLGTGYRPEDGHLSISTAFETTFDLEASTKDASPARSEGLDGHVMQKAEMFTTRDAEAQTDQEVKEVHSAPLGAPSLAPRATMLSKQGLQRGPVVPARDANLDVPIRRATSPARSLAAAVTIPVSADSLVNSGKDELQAERELCQRESIAAASLEAQLIAECRRESRVESEATEQQAAIQRAEAETRMQLESARQLRIEAFKAAQEASESSEAAFVLSECKAALEEHDADEERQSELTEENSEIEAALAAETAIVQELRSLCTTESKCYSLAMHECDTLRRELHDLTRILPAQPSQATVTGYSPVSPAASGRLSIPSKPSTPSSAAR
ncbi:unnamed protein product [Symbiodinium pilosum]|uniref:Uncharacterized protein n=1 Tax=Symbiodinium pilosum TaxID=2952 RepID=A0A812N241_SYMPI|nr:unnamed protein product [Symbiodinium pilosum]